MEKEVKKSKLKTILNFGKYKGKTIEYVLKWNPEYLVWAHTTIKWFKLEDNLYKKAIMRANEELGRKIRQNHSQYYNRWDNDESINYEIYGHDIWD